MLRRLTISAANLRPVQSYIVRQHRAWSSSTSGDGGDKVDGVDNTPDLDHPTIPPYKEREGETFEAKKARVVYQSRKRGMLENDLILGTFCSRYLDTMTEEQVHMFDTLINKPDNDWDIFHWIVQKKETPAEFDNEVMDRLKEFAKNKDMEDRTRMPSLH